MLVLVLQLAVLLAVLVLVPVLPVLAIPAKRPSPARTRRTVAFQEPISASWTRTAQQHQACGARRE